MRRVVITRNQSLSYAQARIVIAVIALTHATIAGVFYMQGLWMVAPVAGIELIFLAIGFHVCLKRQHDVELLEIDENHIKIYRREGSDEQHFSFHVYWTQVKLKISKSWYPSRLLMTCKGTQVEIGSWLTEVERNRLADRLCELLICK